MTEQTIADQLGEDIVNKLEGAENASNPINQIKRRIDENDTTRGFSIARIPTEAHEDFKTLAENMFGNDYGMTLAFLVHYFKINDQHNQQVQDIKDELTSRLDRIEKQLQESGEENTNKVETLQ